MSVLRASAAGAALALALTGCSSDDPRPRGTATPAASLAAVEGALTLVVPSGYAEQGGTDPAADWVTPFEEATGCDVTVRTVGTAREVRDKIAVGGYDGGLVPAEVAGELIAANGAAPLNTGLVPALGAIAPELRALVTEKPAEDDDEDDGKKRKDVVYGVPNAWGADLLLYDPRVAAPTSWGEVFAPQEAHRGAVLWRDTPTTLGLAALYLKERRPKLKIGDPFSLTRPQLDAVAEVLAAERGHVKTVWRDGSQPVEALATGGAALEMADAHTLDVLLKGGLPVAEAAPREGRTGWANAWMMSATARHPGCMYRWMDWATSPAIQRAMAEWKGVAPANPEACATLRPGFCTAYHVGDRPYLNTVTFAHSTTPASCEDCADWNTWTRTWSTLTAQP
ncbi:putative spermidine/putrescine transport system substrate-binding protein [Actinocorallia herbida]|uniref:Putative spermidine/putrescine transport system substrate-binding protein n=1 Tax=Actinocorallia herbida TaxID=58109 RepID=A0A3N1CQN7_9ACTN|nr:extracellular solute-binding protein [Actinocorallia herbida]ROO83454.1 putative spermidine/putrescine transport system substrate-binding protein [Actinocorallia herbida]